MTTIKTLYFTNILVLMSLSFVVVSCNDTSVNPENDTSKIIYLSDKDGNIDSIFTSYKKHDVFIMNSDGSNQINLTNSPEIDFTTVLVSPNGDKILYRNVGFGFSNYFIMNLDGSQKKELTSSTHDNFGASFSPNGNNIVYVSQTTVNEIVIIDINGNIIKNLSQENGIQGVNPIFSSDGEKICFNSQPSNNGLNQIYIVSKDGSNLKQLTADTLSYYNNLFSKDNKRIYFTGLRNNEGMEIFSINIDGSGFKKLTNTNYQFFYGDIKLSPDGNKLLFSRSSNIYSLNIDGTNLIQLTSNGEYHNATYFPDGNKILYVKKVNELFQIFEMNSDGSNQINLSNNNFNNANPVLIY